MKEGRPATHIEKDQIESLMRLKPTLADTAAFFKCSERTIERFIREHWDMSFVEFREQNMVHTRLTLVREAIKQANNGNTAMLIFCLKNVCHWADKVDVNSGATKVFKLRYNLDDEPAGDIVDVEANSSEPRQIESAEKRDGDGERS